MKNLLPAISAFFVIMLSCFDPSWAQGSNFNAPTWRGSYNCIQGNTGLTLSVDLSTQTAKFEFYPLRPTDPVARGSFFLRGRLPLKGSEMVLEPTRWSSQPPGYTMVGLRGTSYDGGVTYQGRITGGTACSTFTLRRVMP